MTLFFDGYHFPWVHVARQVRADLVRAEAVHRSSSAFIWLRATQPRLRYDQLMRFGWKVLLPVATVNALVTAFLVVLVK